MRFLLCILLFLSAFYTKNHTFLTVCVHLWKYIKLSNGELQKRNSSNIPSCIEHVYNSFYFASSFLKPSKNNIFIGRNLRHGHLCLPLTEIPLWCSVCIVLLLFLGCVLCKLHVYEGKWGKIICKWQNKQGSVCIWSWFITFVQITPRFDCIQKFQDLEAMSICHSWHLNLHLFLCNLMNNE